MRDLQAEALGGDLDLDLVIVDQAERVPDRLAGVGRAGPWRHLAQHALIECFVEGQREDGRLAVQFELRAEQSVALENVVRGQRGQTQAFDAAFDGLAGGELDALDGAFQRGGQAVDGVRFHACAAT